MQVKPGSTRHAAEHPSPADAFPSRHNSRPPKGIVSIGNPGELEILDSQEVAMPNRDDDKEKQEKQQQSGSGSGRPATKFMEKPKQGQEKKQDPQQWSGTPIDEVDIGEESDTGNLREDVDEGGQGMGGGGVQQQKPQEGQKGQQQKGKQQQKPDDN